MTLPEEAGGASGDERRAPGAGPAPDLGEVAAALPDKPVLDWTADDWVRVVETVAVDPAGPGTGEAGEPARLVDDELPEEYDAPVEAPPPAGPTDESWWRAAAPERASASELPEEYDARLATELEAVEDERPAPPHPGPDPRDDPRGDDPPGPDPRDDPRGDDPPGDDPPGGDPRGDDPPGGDPPGGDPPRGDPPGDDPPGDDPPVPGWDRAVPPPAHREAPRSRPLDPEVRQALSGLSATARAPAPPRAAPGRDRVDAGPAPPRTAPATKPRPAPPGLQPVRVERSHRVRSAFGLLGVAVLVGMVVAGLIAVAILAISVALQRAAG